MTIESKVGQLFLLAFGGKDPYTIEQFIVEYGIGGCYISQDNAATPQEAIALSSTLQSLARKSKYRIPLILGVDQEGAWGVLVPYSTTGPGNLALGAAHDLELTYKMYEIIATEMLAVGYNAIFAPCVDIIASPNSMLGARSFGDNPKGVGLHAAAAVQGALSTGIITTAKHFPGHGHTEIDTHRELPIVNLTLQELKEGDLYPFLEAIRAGADMVMTSHIVYLNIDPDRPATLSPLILQNVLRQEMNFSGLVISDSMNMGAIKKYYTPEESIVKAIAAGVDMIMLAEEHYDYNPTTYLDIYKKLIENLIKAVRKGYLAEDRINEAAGRVLTLKLKKGLFSDISQSLPLSIIGSREHRETEQLVARRAITSLRDRQHILPLDCKNTYALVNAVPREAYKVLTSTRGIGPNQDIPAFDAFLKEVKSLGIQYYPIYYNDIFSNSNFKKIIQLVDFIIVVLEDYPLPGVDFDTTSQTNLLKKLITEFTDKIIVVALKPPFDLSHFPNLDTYVCAFSSRVCSAKAVAQAIFGLAPIGGISPIAID